MGLRGVAYFVLGEEGPNTGESSAHSSQSRSRFRRQKSDFGRQRWKNNPGGKVKLQEEVRGSWIWVDPALLLSSNMTADHCKELSL